MLKLFGIFSEARFPWPYAKNV